MSNDGYYFPGRKKVREIIARVAVYYDVTPEDILGDNRVALVCEARHMAMYLARTLTHASTIAIGKHFGGRHHTTVMMALRKIEKLLQWNPHVGETVAAIMAAPLEQPVGRDEFLKARLTAVERKIDDMKKALLAVIEAIDSMRMELDGSRQEELRRSA